jgi:hypothetical protein
MGIIDELAEETGYHPAKKEEGKAFRPSSYNPLRSFPENLGHNLQGAGSELMKGGEQLGQGDLLSGAFHTGMGALEGVYSPLEAGVQTATQPLSDATGVPDWLLTGAAMLPLGYKSLAGGARRLMGIGGAEAGAEAAPIAEAASKAEPRVGATNRKEWEQSYGERKKAYEEGVAGRRGAQMEDAASRTPPVSPAERFFPRLLTHGGEDNTVFHMPNESVAPKQPMRESYAEGYRPGEPQRQIEYKPTPAPAIPMPDYTAEKFMGMAAKRSGEMKAERDASRIPNTPAPHTRQIRRPEEEMPPSLGKEEKLSRLESESMRSIDDAVRTLNAGGMSAADAQKHILNNIRAGRMTAVRPNGAPLTKQEAKLIRSLKGLGGVSWIRG